MTEEASLYTIYLVFHFSQVLSFIFVTFALLMAFTVFKVNEKLNNKINYRLSILVLCSDIIFLTFQFISRYSNSDAVCVLSAWGVVFSTLISMFYTVVIAVNLQITFIHKAYANRYTIWAYYTCPAFFALLLSLLPVFVGQIGLHQEGDTVSCWYKAETSGTIWSYTTFYGWILFGIFYCFCVITTIISLHYLRRYYFKSEFANSIANGNNKSNTAILRVLLYPGVPVVCYFCIMVKLFSGIQSTDLTIAADFFQSLQGFLNSIIFLTSPTFLQEIRYSKVKLARQLNAKISLYPNSKFITIWTLLYTYLTLDTEISLSF
ncbi:hypothetical protein K502DRAFT_368263 [Neoconidiobolus thromboides FSU 785]|nr:hypothetical protein K502DRAFT_368263 [Neoconidiobolus thromboides FSU 785]